MDVWAAGCTFFELLEGEVLFRGADTYIELLGLIFRFLGTPRAEVLDSVENEHARKWILQQKVCPPARVSARLTREGVSAEARDLLDRCLTVDPAQRITALGALRHPFFAGLFEEGVDDSFEPAVLDFGFEARGRTPSSLEPLLSRIRTEVQLPDA